MLRSLTFLLLAGELLAAPVRTAVWPEQFGPFTRGAVSQVALGDRAVWEEYGLATAEQAVYASGARRLTAVAYRFKDPTGAMAAFQWQRPVDATPSKLSQLAVEMPAGALFTFHNYLFRLDGWKPDAADLTPLLEGLTRLDQGPLPALSGYLPTLDLIPNSERYVLGPASLAHFDPRVPPSAAAFHLGTEAQFGRFKGKGGELGLAVFSFPTPNLAKERAAEFSKLPEAMVKRTGPLVAVILAPPDADEAERLLAKVQYQAAITWTERVPTQRDNIGNLILNIFTLIGVLLAFCAAAGLALGGFRVLARRYFKNWSDETAMITLHLEDR